MTDRSIKEIESALLCGYSSVTVDGVKVPLSKWELNPRHTRKQKEDQARQNALNIYTVLIGKIH